MKVYQISWTTSTGDSGYSWESSEIQAKRAVATLKKLGTLNDLDYELRDIPTKRKELIAWLNEFCAG